MRPYYRISFLLSVLLTVASLAKAAGTSATSGSSSLNPVLIGLVTLIVVLLFAIVVLGNVLRQLAAVYRDKMRKDRSGGNAAGAIAALLGWMMLCTLPSYAQSEGAKEVISPFIAGVPRYDFYALMSVLGLELLILCAMLFYLSILLKAISARPEKEKTVKAIVQRIPFWDKMNAVVPLEKEEHILLDHEYDGIRELDNSLPPWWKYGFYLTIVISVIYLWYYHGGGNGPGSEEEYIAAVIKGEEEKAVYLAKTAGNIDETNVVMTDAAGIAEGKTLYAKNCAACHASDGGGSVGPNLADEYWLHGGSLTDVFKSIKYGWQDKGMKPWKDDFSPKQLASLASFVRSLQGSVPAVPKAAQGDLYAEVLPAAETENTIQDKVIAVQ